MADADLPDDWTDRYLARIGAPRPKRADYGALVDLVARHIQAVPFENLDIGLRREIVLDTKRLIEKIVVQRRGGFCFEVNEAFRALLASLGFPVRRIEGRVWLDARQAFGQPFDHLALVVELPEGEYLVDVGFGDNNRAPLRLPDGETTDLSGQYRLRPRPADFLVLERLSPDSTRPLYEVTLESRSLADFEPMCRYHQTSAESIFTKGPICTRATPSGRVRLSQHSFVEVDGSDRRETLVTDDAARSKILLDHFGIDLRWPA